MKKKNKTQEHDFKLEQKKKKAKEKLQKLANPKCHKCYGEGYLGWNNIHQHWWACQCIVKNARPHLQKKSSKEK